jgi:NitT/TauT family transport system substrate-binding protein
MIRWTSAFTGALLLAVTLSAPGPVWGQAMTMTLAESVAPISGVSVIARAKSLFEKEGLDVKVRNLATGKLTFDALIGGAAQLATSSDVVIMRGALASQDLAVIATTFRSDNDVKVVVRKDRDIRGAADLKGKKVATIVGTSAEFFLHEYLKTAGLKVSDVRLTNLRGGDMPQALQRGDIDAYVGFEPYTYYGRRLMGDAVEVLPTRGFYLETFNIVTLRSFVDKNKDAVLRFVRALLAAEEFIKTNKAEAIAIIAKHSSMEPDVLQSLWGDFVFEVTLDQSLADTMGKEARWAMESGTAPSAPTVPSFASVLYRPGATAAERSYRRRPSSRACVALSPPRTSCRCFPSRSF